MAEQDDLEREVASQRAGYAARLPERLAEIERTWARIAWDGRHEIDLHALRLHVHSLSGSGKVFGFATLGGVAHELDERLGRIAQAGAAPGEEERNQIRDLLGALRKAAAQGGCQG